MWKYSKHVETPNIEEDIKEMLSEEVLSFYDQCSNENYKRVVKQVVELLDLIKHLEHFYELLGKNSKKTCRVKDNRMYCDDHTNIDGMDFSGCQFDFEALVIYLYVSCIEGCTQTKFITIKDFLERKLNDDENYAKNNILDLCEEHSEQYGLRKKFIKVFVEWISSPLKEEFANNIVILSTKKNKTEISTEKIKSSINSWKEKDIEKRLKDIADYLYSIRSKYTHANSRVFYPTKEWDGESSVSVNDRCFVTEKIEFPKILKEVIKELCVKILKEELK